MLWFNCELRIETGNEKKTHTKQNTPLIHDFRLNFSKQNTVYILFSKRGKGTYIKH